MSKKFEQLLDYLVNEEMDKANELFHEIVVEKSREIYENMIAEEAAEEDVEEASEQEEESVEEEVDEEIEEGFGDETTMEIGGDAAGQFGDDVEDHKAMGDEEDGDEDEEPGEMPGEGGDVSQGEEQIIDILQQLKAEFDQLVHGSGAPEGDMDDMDDMGGPEEEPKGDEGMMMGQFEGRTLTREYVETVGNDWEKNSQKAQGQYAGSGSGEKDAAPVEGRSPVSSAKGKPTTGATAHNILGSKGQEGSSTGTSPNAKTGGLGGSTKGEFTGSGTGNVNGTKSGVKTLSKVSAGHGAEKKGSGEGAGNTKAIISKAQ